MKPRLRHAWQLLLCLPLCLELPAVLAKPPGGQRGAVRFAAESEQASGELESLREQVKALDGQPQQAKFLLNLYAAEYRAGNYVRAADARERLLVHPQLTDALRLVLDFIDARYRARAGDIPAARNLWNEGSALLARLPADDPANQHVRQRYLTLEAEAETIIQRSEGRFEAADRAMQRALAANDAFRNYFVSGPGHQLADAGQNLAQAASDRARLLSEQITLQLQSGRLGAAELTALDWIKVSGEPEAPVADPMLALKRYGDVLLASRRFDRALETFDQAIAGYRAAGRGELAGDVLLAKRSRAQALMCLERWQEAHDAFRNLEQMTKGIGGARDILRGGIDRALARVMSGNTMESGGRGPLGPEQLISNAEAKLERGLGPDHPQVVLAQGVHGLVLARQGYDDRALTYFRRYADKHGLSSAGDDAGSDESALTHLYHRLILESYLALLADRRDAAAIDSAFQVADALRGGRVQQAIAASAARGAVRDPELAKLVRSEQDLAAELAALYRALGAAADGDAPGDLRSRIRALEERRGAALATLRSRYPDYDRLVRPLSPTPTELAAQLAADEVFVSIYGTADATYVFAVGKDGKSTLHVARSGAREIAAAVQGLRAALDVGDIPLERLPPFDVAAAHRLYQDLLGPLKPTWGRAQHLIVSASGPLAQLPFSLLVERPGAVFAGDSPFAGYADVAWLLRERAISHVPSAAAFVALRRLPPPGRNRQPFVGFGDPDFGAPSMAAGKLRAAPRRGAGGERSAQALRAAYRALPPLPDTRDEVLALARALKADSDAAVLGASASRINVMQRDLSQRKVVAFATHGLQPGELPGLDEPALALALPASEAQSPLLTLSDVLGLKLDADWVVLSACNTAGADGEAAEALSGLGRGFFFAGARSLLVTHWPVESVSARRLVSAIFTRSAGTRADALRLAQLDLLRERSADGYSYAHPLFWAAFTLVGDGGR